MSAFGTWIDDLTRIDVTRIEDDRLDACTADTQALEKQRKTSSFLNAPVVVSGVFAAFCLIDTAEVHHWQDGEVAFVRDVAERTRAATERLTTKRLCWARPEDSSAFDEKPEQCVEFRYAALQLYKNVQSNASPICAVDRDLRMVAGNPAHSDTFLRRCDMTE